MELPSMNSGLKRVDQKPESPLLNPSLQNVSSAVHVPNSVTSQDNNLAEYQGSEISYPNLPLLKWSKQDRGTIRQKSISNQRSSLSNDPSDGDLPLANLHPAKQNISLKRKPDSPSSSNTKKIMVSPLNEYLSKQYVCSICGKSFRSYQALGGHKVHHNKKAPAIDADAIARYAMTKRFGHLCDFCNKVYSTGQALGGHKRHCREPVPGQEAHRNGEIREGRNQNIGLNFDLNELP